MTIRSGTKNIRNNVNEFGRFMARDGGGAVLWLQPPLFHYRPRGWKRQHTLNLRRSPFEDLYELICWHLATATRYLWVNSFWPGKEEKCDCAVSGYCCRTVQMSQEVLPKKKTFSHNVKCW